MNLMSNFLHAINDKEVESIEIEEMSLKSIKSRNIAVSFNESLRPISFWSDDVWDFSNLNIKKKIIDISQYREIMTDELYEEFKLSVYSLFLSSYASGYKTDIIKIASSLVSFFEDINKLGFKSLLDINDEFKFLKLLEKTKGVYSSSTLITKLISLRSIEKLNLHALPLDIGLNSKKRTFKNSSFSIDDIAKKYANQKKIDKEQSLYIPQKIHSKLISECINVIERNTSILRNINNLLEEDYLIFEDLTKKQISKGITDKSIIVDRIRIYRSYNNDSLSVKELLVKHNLDKRFENYESIKKECRLMSVASFCLIATFTGMRSDEIFNIKINGYKKVNTSPKMHIIRSFETKISGGQDVDYITSPIIEKVFDSLLMIQGITRKYGDPINVNKLFCLEKRQKLLSYGDKSQMRKNMKNFIKEIGLKVDKESFGEHQKINGINESVKVGEVWPLKSHQFRRTLIMNFVAHNLSDISAVKQQVKHMYATMTEYYANNSQVLSQLHLNQSSSIISEIEEEKLSENIRKYKEFYYGKDILSGVKGHEIRQERNIVAILSDEDIKVMFKTGAYKLTRSTYGFCTKGDLCDKSDIADPSFCGMSCSTMIITKDNALEWKKLYNRNIKLLSESDKYLMIGSMKMEGAVTMMENQNLVAKKILKEFDIEVEDE